MSILKTADAPKETSRPPEYFFPDRGETVKDARKLEGWVRGSVQEFAERAAASVCNLTTVGEFGGEDLVSAEELVSARGIDRKEEIVVTVLDYDHGSEWVVIVRVHAMTRYEGDIDAAGPISALLEQQNQAADPKPQVHGIDFL